MKPPAVEIDEHGAELQFNGVRQWRIAWSQVREIAVEVTVLPELEYSEAFWKLSGGPVEFGAPVELVAGADAFNARLFGFPGFDREAFQRARQAEAEGTAGHFVCWRAVDAQ